MIRERKNPVIENSVFVTFTKGKITCLKRDHALQNNFIVSISTILQRKFAVEVSFLSKTDFEE